MKKETSFDDLIQAIQDAFIKVNNMSEAQHLQKISDYFDEENNAKMFEIQYPKFNEEGRIQYMPLRVPQICLLPMSSLKLDEAACRKKRNRLGCNTQVYFLNAN